MIREIISNTVMITSFVLVMMLLIEYINVQTKGNWSKPIQRNKFLQVIIATILGLVPGCLGSYVVVSLYTHNILGFGALIATMIATTGDEAFFMFSMIPKTALEISGIVAALAITVGVLINLFFRKKTIIPDYSKHFEIHKEEINHCTCYNTKDIIKHLKNISFHRAILISGIVLFVVGMLTGYIEHVHLGEAGHEGHHHDEWNWVQITFLIVSSFALFVVTTVPDHFLEEHLWGHIIKKHFLKIFLWTLGAIVFVHFMLEYIDIEQWLQSNMIIVLLIAILIGIIPESGPHLIFITMFFNGAIPFSILLANSIVQDGHGALPLFAESKKSFVIMKFIKIIIALIFGFAGIYFGW